MTDIFKDGLIQEHNGMRMYTLTPEEVKQLFEAFLARLLEETDLRMWPNRHLDCQGVTDDKGKIG